jgi:RNA recognition motif-containing protein
MPKIPIDYTSIFVGQLDAKTDEIAIRDRFCKYGNIIGVQVLSKGGVMGRAKAGESGFAFVKYESRDSATKAVKAEVSRNPTPRVPGIGCRN